MGEMGARAKTRAKSQTTRMPLTPRAPIPDSRIAQFMQPCTREGQG